MEFTGERVVPGLVNDDLWAEHAARYAFACRYAHGARTLEIACGSGYGAAELALQASEVVALDVSEEAVRSASEHFQGSNIRYLRASASSLPFAAASFDLITAFEVIEHLDDWRSLIDEAARVLKPEGVLLVSTPNKLYYAESRAEHGPNPFHVHEFEYAEFRDALGEAFAHVELLLQDRLEAFAFYGTGGQPTAKIEKSEQSPEDANFFLGICSNVRPAVAEPFVFVPKTANLLRERERHIALLEDELKKNKGWLADRIAAHALLQEEHDALNQHLESQNRWAERLESELRVARSRVAELQESYAELERASQEALDRAAASYSALEAHLAQVHEGYRAQIEAMAAEDRAKTEHARTLEADLAATIARLTRSQEALDRAESEVEKRTEWAWDLERQLRASTETIRAASGSKWIRLGRAVGLGPKL